MSNEQKAEIIKAWKELAERINIVVGDASKEYLVAEMARMALAIEALKEGN